MRMLSAKVERERRVPKSRVKGDGKEELRVVKRRRERRETRKTGYKYGGAGRKQVIRASAAAGTAPPGRMRVAR